MNFGTAFNVLGALLMVEGAFLMPPLLYAVCHGEGSIKAFIIALALALIVGALLFFMPRKEERIRGRDGLFIVAVGWIVASFLGAVPIYLGGGTPNYIDALFETVSGFTTTGASVIPNVEAIDKSIVLWRSMTHWIGGMGILVFTLALLPRGGLTAFAFSRRRLRVPWRGKWNLA